LYVSTVVVATFFFLLFLFSWCHILNRMRTIGMESVFFFFSFFLVIGHKRRWSTLCTVCPCSFHFYSFFLLLFFLYYYSRL
jgi:hypothetical protein